MKATDITDPSDKLIINILDRILPSTVKDKEYLEYTANNLLDMLISTHIERTREKMNNWSACYDLNHELRGACRVKLLSKLVETYNLRQLDKIL